MGVQEQPSVTARRHTGGIVTVRMVTAAMCLLVATGAPAGAQAAGDERAVTIDFEVGDFDPDRADWPITVVNVSGELEPGEVFVVELRDGDGAVIWAGEGVFTPPITSVLVGSFVAVGDVEEAAIGQMLPEEITTTTTTTIQEAEPVVAGDVVTIPTTPSTTAPEVPETTAPLPPPEVEGDVVTQPQVRQQGSGVGGAGQLALSMVIAVVFVAILFRAPLPAATTTRWRK